jgi:outer membrane immunogenic protein
MKVVLGAVAALGLATSVSVATAADLRMPVKAPAMVPVYNWTGFYVGGNIGYSFGRSRHDWSAIGPGGTVGLTGSNSHNLDGVVGGGQIGYNWQVTNWVVGLEADFQGTGERGSNSGICLATIACTRSFFDVSQRLEWFGTLRGRVGYTVAPTWLLYGTGGLAYGHVKTTVDATIAGVAGTAGSSETAVGYTVGGGIEAALGGNWTGKAEYLYVDLGKVSGSYAAQAGTLQLDSRVTDHVLRFGVNYHFPAAMGPVVAKY